MKEQESEVELIYYLNVLWKRKWFIIFPTVFLVIAAVIISYFILTPRWEVDTVFLPSKFFIQTEQGRFEEVVVVSAKQIAGQINEASYNHLIIEYWIIC